MDYEKEYKEALERGKALHKNGAYRLLMEEIFPELAESEDEKIRKELLHMFDEQRGYVGGNAEWINGVDYDSVVAWLEKQGEQKSVNEADEDIVEVVKDTSILDMVEPKFHEGDWVVYKNDICQIVKREEDCNKLVTVFGIEKELVNERNLSTARLWTIEDAKDGDVLHSTGWHNECTFIFNGFGNWMFSEPNGDKAFAKGCCCLSVSSDKTEFDIQGPGCVEVNTIKPATKIQRDLLFQKMKDAGYEWDAEKKELKLLITNGGDYCQENCKGFQETGKCFADGDCEAKINAEKKELKKCVIDEGKAEMDYCFTKMMNGEKVSSTWTEEDEYTLNETIQHLEELIRIDKAKYLGCDVQYYQRDIDWLKSFKDKVQPQWKPTKEQMKFLAHYADQNNYDGTVLTSLLNDLKKLITE